MTQNWQHFFNPPWSPVMEKAGGLVFLDQTRLPFEEVWLPLRDMATAAQAIRAMQVRGAPLIGITAAFGLALQMDVDASDASLTASIAELAETRPTAVNLRWALNRMNSILAPLPVSERAAAAWTEARAIAAEDIQTGAAIAKHGYELVKTLHAQKGGTAPLRILTHCNAGWLGTMAWGTALAVMYGAQHFGLPIHVYVDETRPRFQGALTAWELGRAGISHQVITDNAGGHLMQEGLVDVAIVGADRVARNGDAANKIGTYLKALAAFDNNIPFYVALPATTFDFALASGVRAIPIEERAAAEVLAISGRTAAGEMATVQPYPANTLVSNPGFDVTPARLISGLITERGICAASEAGIQGMFADLM